MALDNIHNSYEVTGDSLRFPHSRQHDPKQIAGLSLLNLNPQGLLRTYFENKPSLLLQTGLTAPPTLPLIWGLPSLNSQWVELPTTCLEPADQLLVSLLSFPAKITSP